MTRDDAIAALERAAELDDSAQAHARAEEVLCVFLTFLGYQDVVDLYQRVPRAAS